MLRRKISVTLLSALFVVALAWTVYAQNKAVVIPLNSSKPTVADFVGGDHVFALTDADQIIRTVTLDLPSTGLVVANASGYFFTETASIAGPRCSITQGTTLDFNYMTGSLGMISSGMQAIPFGITRAFPLAAGPQVFNLVCDTFSGTVTVEDSNLNAVFYYMPEISIPVAASSRVDKTCDNFIGSCPE